MIDDDDDDECTPGCARCREGEPHLAPEYDAMSPDEVALDITPLQAGETWTSPTSGRTYAGQEHP